MKIALVSAKTSVIDVVPEVAKSLRSQVFGLQVVEKIADTPLDILGEISGLKDCDAVAVILFYESERAEIRVLMEKLADLDIQGRRALKFLEMGDDFSGKEESERISASILEKLFGGKRPSRGSERESYKTI